MSDLEDDVLMQLIDASKRLDVEKTKTAFFKERAALVERVHLDLGELIDSIASDPHLGMLLMPELKKLQKSVAAVLEFDAKHGDGPIA